MELKKDRDNNFDLIRLIAAIQVFVMHAVVYLNIPVSPYILEIADWFPGVPIFFMISGYLVLSSFVRSPSSYQYFRNRALRIFPGLWVCLLLTFIFVAIRGDLADTNTILRSIFWFIANGTIFQFAGAIGTGVANGPLWSISSELQFYILLPLFGVLLSYFKKNNISVLYTTVIIVPLIVISGFFHEYVLKSQAVLHVWVYPTYYASFLANGYLFLMGVLVFIWRDKLMPLVQGRALFFIVLYLVTRIFLLMLGYDAHTVQSTILSVFVYPFLSLLRAC